VNQEQAEFVERLRQLREEAEEGAGLPAEVSEMVADQLLAVERLVTSQGKAKP
jgi:hypothetical protein